MKKEEAKKVENVEIPITEAAEKELKEKQSRIRLEAFAKALENLQKEYNVLLYPTNQAQQNGEVICMIKIMDNLKKE